MAKHCQVNFAEHPGNKAAQVERLRGSVNLGAGGGCELREYHGCLPCYWVSSLIYFLGTNYWPPLGIKCWRTRAFGVPQPTQHTNKGNVHTGVKLKAGGDGDSSLSWLFTVERRKMKLLL